MYIEDKDLFQKFYSRLLARRLIMNTSFSFDLELIVISKLSEICGYAFTSKMQRMFTDISVSKELLEDFKKNINGAQIPLDFNVLILTTGTWPIPADPFQNYQFPLNVKVSIT